MASGHDGLLVNQGSKSTRFPPGVRNRNVACPNQVIDSLSMRLDYVPASFLESLARQMSPVQSVGSVSVEAPLEFVRPREPKPEWLKVRAPGSENYLRLKGIMQDLKLNTVCEDARCPNIGECWHHGTATFMILGDVCTRACAYCAVARGKPTELDTAEPGRR